MIDVADRSRNHVANGQSFALTWPQSSENKLEMPMLVWKALLKQNLKTNLLRQ